jgi:DNA recombination protein RmuC
VYRLQHQFSNGLRSDAVLFAPKPLGTIAIDSKFPLENYRRMIDRTLDQKTQEHYSKLFQMDLKKHIDDISSKYIIYGETSDQAIMFLPAEAIYAEINAYYPQLDDYANIKRFMIVSPTTFMATLTTMQVILKNIERDQYAHVIQTELGKLSLEFNRYKERWDKLSKHIKTVSKDVDDIHITTEKINKRFEQINQVEELLE